MDKMFTVGELIALLQEYSPELPVVMMGPSDSFSQSVGYVGAVVRNVCDGMIMTKEDLDRGVFTTEHAVVLSEFQPVIVEGDACE